MSQNSQFPDTLEANHLRLIHILYSIPTVGVGDSPSLGKLWRYLVE